MTAIPDAATRYRVDEGQGTERSYILFLDLIDNGKSCTVIQSYLMMCLININNITVI